MTGTPDLSDHDEADLLAAEYVLGVLPLPDRLAAERRLAEDPDFAARVLDWETRLAPLAEAYAPLPAPDLLPRIEARLFPAPARPARWRWLLPLGALAAAASVAAVLLLTPAPAPPVIATLAAAEAGGPAFEAHSDGTHLILRRIAGPAPGAQESYELWAIAPGAAPVSLGLAPDATTTLTVATPPAGWTLAISREPAGGSPTGAPTGPVLAAGTVTG